MAGAYVSPQPRDIDRNDLDRAIGRLPQSLESALANVNRLVDSDQTGVPRLFLEALS